MKKSLYLFGLLFTASIIFTSCNRNEQVVEITHNKFTILPNGLGSEYTIIYHIFDTNADGPNFAIIAGVHGPEEAGWLAALHIVENFDFSQGRFLIIPKVSPTAIEARNRYTAGYDLNRQFPGCSDGNTAQRVAAAVTEVLKNFEPDVIIDLHEARLGSDWESSQALVNTIIYSTLNPYTTELAREAVIFAVNAINDTYLIDCNRPFRPLGGAGSRGTTHREFSVKFNVPSFITETGRPDGGQYNPIDLRVQQQLFLVNALVYFFLKQ